MCHRSKFSISRTHTLSNCVTITIYVTSVTIVLLYYSSPYYHEGSNANCNEPLCCRLTDGIPESPSNGAGRWGDYRKCDTPRHTIESMLQHIANYHQVLNLSELN